MSSHSRSIWFLICISCLTVMSAGCKSYLPKASPLSPGTLEGTLDVGSDKRSYRLHIPKGYSNEKPLPLIVALHGAFSSARKMERFSGLSALADEEAFIVVYPNGIGLFGFLRHWNAGFCCGRAMKADWNDTGFLLRLIDVLPEKLAIDRRRIYLVGMSNGGMLAHRFAAEYPDQIAAVTLVAAAVGARWKKQEEMQGAPFPQIPVPALIIHAKDDPVIPFEGGRGRSRGDVEYLGPKDAAAFWRQANHCEPLLAETVQLQGGNLTRWADCLDGSEVVFLSVDYGGHAWPGERTEPPIDVRTVDATETAWRFMSRFSRD